MSNEVPVMEALTEIIRCTLPFYGWVNYQPVQNGTGVLLQIGHAAFILAAAHVLDYPAIHEIHYVTADEQGQSVPLHFKKVVTSPVPPGSQPKDSDMRDDDPWDIGIAELAPETADKLRTYWRFAQLREIDAAGTIQGTFLVAGYPFALTETKTAERNTETKMLKYITGIYDGEREQQDNDAELLLDYPEQSLTADSAATTAPQPKGLSGCGIWRLSESIQPLTQWKASDIRLVGIQHRWRSSRRYLVGTPIRHAMQLIYKYYPELHGDMSLAYPH
jgi:hypothetical protein